MVKHAVSQWFLFKMLLRDQKCGFVPHSDGKSHVPQREFTIIWRNTVKLTKHRQIDQTPSN
jgi:hypothetical protein